MASDDSDRKRHMRAKLLQRGDFIDEINNGDRTKRAKYIERHFYYFSLICSLNHALSYVVTAFSSTLLVGNLGGIANGLTWSLNAVSGLTIATPLVRGLGYKSAMIISLCGYAVQIASLFISVQFPAVQWPVAIVGASVAGVLSAVWWTAQGVCFELSCVEICNETSRDINVVRANLSAYWTLIYQLADIVVFLTLSLLPIFCNTSFTNVLLGLTVLGVATALLGFTFDSLGDAPTTWSREELHSAVLAVPKQFVHDSRAGLLAPFVFGFGITTAMFAYYINDAIVSDNLGVVYIGFLEALAYFVAMTAAFPYAFISNYFSAGRHFVMEFGSACFMMSGLLVLLLSDSQLGTWGSSVALRICYGLGRGVFEGSCRAVYADVFKGEDLATAFSGQTLLAGFSGGICFFLYGSLDKRAIAGITVGNGALAIGAYFLMMSHPHCDWPLSWSESLCFRGPFYKPRSSVGLSLLNPVGEEYEEGEGFGDRDMRFSDRSIEVISGDGSHVLLQEKSL